MKVLIVDDERHVREGIKILGDWNRYNITEIYEAENGMEAIKRIVEHRPEIIFTDVKMPVMDGMELLKWINAEGIRAKTVVVTGFNEYDYMRKAIQYETVDYLLKPIDPLMLNETLHKAIQKWNESEQILKTIKVKEQLEVQSQKQLMINQLSTLLQKGNATVENEKLLESLGIREGKPIQICITKFYPSMYEHLVSQNLSLEELITTINEKLADFGASILFANEFKKDELCLLFSGTELRLLHVLRQLNEHLFEQYGIRFVFYRGEEFNYTSQLKDSYLQAIKCKKTANIFKQKLIYEKVEPHQVYSHPLEYGKELELAFQVGSETKLEQIKKALLYEVEQRESLNLYQINIWEQELLLLKEKWEKELQSISFVDTVPLPQHYWTRLGIFQYDQYIDDRIKLAKRLIQQLNRNQLKSEMQTIHLVEDYIQHHYEREISLQEISDKFYVSREYISRKFKSEYGQNLSEYLTNVRIEKAKLLLKDVNLKVYEIAHIIGYQDDKYFRKVFKKVVGVTPNEFRKKFEKDN